MLVYIEISKGSNVKYEYNKELKGLVLDRILHNTNTFPYNYGYIPNTLSPDGDPVDVIVLCDCVIQNNCYVNCKVVGGIETEDESGIDDKIIAVLDEKLDKKSKYINDIQDVNKGDLDNIIYFLNHYKDNEKNKFVKVGKTYNRDQAIKVIEKYTTL